MCEIIEHHLVLCQIGKASCVGQSIIMDFYLVKINNWTTFNRYLFINVRYNGHNQPKIQIQVMFYTIDENHISINVRQSSFLELNPCCILKSLIYFHLARDTFFSELTFKFFFLQFGNACIGLLVKSSYLISALFKKPSEMF